MELSPQACTTWPPGLVSSQQCVSSQANWYTLNLSRGRWISASLMSEQPGLHRETLFQKRQQQNLFSKCAPIRFHLRSLETSLTKKSDLKLFRGGSWLWICFVRYQLAVRAPSTVSVEVSFALLPGGSMFRWGRDLLHSSGWLPRQNGRNPSS